MQMSEYNALTSPPPVFLYTQGEMKRVKVGQCSE